MRSQKVILQNMLDIDAEWEKSNKTRLWLSDNYRRHELLKLQQELVFVQLVEETKAKLNQKTAPFNPLAPK